MSSRSASSRLVVVGAVLGAVGLGSMTGPPAQAAGAGGSSGSGSSAYKPYAKVTEKDAPLRSGCRHYSYTYKVTAPTDQWSVQLFLKNPNGHGVASAYLDAASDPAQGTRSWYLCKPSTVSGRYHVKIKVVYDLDPYTSMTAFAKPTFFRLTRPDGRGR